jgi:hypothetical protein
MCTGGAITHLGHLIFMFVRKKMVLVVNYMKYSSPPRICFTPQTLLLMFLTGLLMALVEHIRQNYPHGEENTKSN